MKKIIIGILSFALVFSVTGFAFADDDNTVSVGASTNVVSSVKTERGNGDIEVQDDNQGNVKRPIPPSIAPSATARGSEEGNFQKDLHEGRLDFSASSTVTTANMAQIKAQADQAIARRIDGLNKLQSRVNEMKRVTDAERASLTSRINASITDMNNLKVKIDADTDISVLKTDVLSIASSYRIFALIMPQISIWAATDRIHTIVGMMTTIGTKFDARINDAASKGKDVSALQSAFSDYKLKIADAEVQAKAAESLIANLSPDNGDKSIADANRQALQSARTKVQAGMDDLSAARKDADSIIKGLKAFGDVTVTATSSPTVSNQ